MMTFVDGDEKDDDGVVDADVCDGDDDFKIHWKAVQKNGRGCEENGNKASVDKLMDPWKEEKKKQQHTARPKTACFYSTGMKPWPRERRLSHDHLQRRSKPSSERSEKIASLKLETK